MRNIWAVYKRELGAYFYSPLAYVLYVFFLIVCGMFFNFNFTFYYNASQQYLQMMALQQGMFSEPLPNYTEVVLIGNTNVMTFILLFIIPMLSMRLFSEEKKLGTIELLMTYPIRDAEVLLGKYFAALTVFAGMLAWTLPYALISMYVVPDQTYLPPLLASYLGVFFVGAAFLSFGMLASALTENQIVAGLITFAALLGLWMVGFVEDLYAYDDYARMIGTVCSHLSVYKQFGDFSKGVISTSSAAYYILFSVFFLFVTLRVLESNRWRG